MSKISALTEVTSPLLADYIPIVDTSGTLATKRVTLANLLKSMPAFTVNGNEITNAVLNAPVLKGTATASGTFTMPAFTMGGNIDTNAKYFTGGDPQILISVAGTVRSSLQFLNSTNSANWMWSHRLQAENDVFDLFEYVGGGWVQLMQFSNVNPSVLTWSNLTHTGIKLSGGIDVNGTTWTNTGGTWTVPAFTAGGAINANSQEITNFIRFRSKDSSYTYIEAYPSKGLYFVTENAAGTGALARVQFDGGVTVGTVSFLNGTLVSGLKLGGALDANSQSITSIASMTSGKIVFNRASLPVAGEAGIGADNSGGNLAINGGNSGVNFQIGATTYVRLTTTPSALFSFSNGITITGAKLGAALDGNGYYITDSLGLSHASVTNLSTTLYGGTSAAGSGAAQVLAGKTAGYHAGGYDLYTPNTAGNADRPRIYISGNLDTAVATCTNLTWTGFLASGSVVHQNTIQTQWQGTGGGGTSFIYQANDNVLVFAALGIKAAVGGNTFKFRTGNAADSETDRLAISGGVATAIATWSAITHSGMQFSNYLLINNNVDIRMNNAAGTAKSFAYVTAGDVLTINNDALATTFKGVIAITTALTNGASPATAGFLRVSHNTYTLVGLNNAGASSRDLISWGVAGTDILKLVADGNTLHVGSPAIWTTSIDSAAVADQVAVGGFDIAAGHRALSLSCEEVTVNAAAGASDVYIPVRINGVTLKWLLHT